MAKKMIHLKNYFRNPKPTELRSPKRSATSNEDAKPENKVKPPERQLSIIEEALY